jgi:hypothetical protein
MLPDTAGGGRIIFWGVESDVVMKGAIAGISQSLLATLSSGLVSNKV